MSGSPAETTTWTVARLLAWTQEFFTQRGLSDARLCAEILLAHSMQTERLRLYTCWETEPAEAARTTFRALVKEAAAGRPIAYLIGRKEFLSLAFEVTPDVLIPRPETEILVERAINLVRKGGTDHPWRVLDVGTGSGCIAISLARHVPSATVAASDVSEAALTVAQRNAERHGVHERITWRCGDLLSPWTNEPPFDLVVSNPPYVATEGAPLERSVRDHEPHVALFAGGDGLDVIRRLLRDVPRHLRPGGHLLMEIGFDQAAAVRQLAADSGWQLCGLYRDGGGHERVLHVARSQASAQVA